MKTDGADDRADLTPVYVGSCGVIVLLALVLIAYLADSHSGTSLATSPTWVRIGVWVFLPGFFVDVLIREALHHGPPEFLDWVILVGVSWIVWNGLILGLSASIRQWVARRRAASRLLLVVLGLWVGSVGMPRASDKLTLDELAEMLAREKPEISCSAHELVDAYGARGVDVYVIRARCNFRPVGTEPFYSTKHFVIVIRSRLRGLESITVTQSGDDVPARLDLDDPLDISYPKLSEDSEGWGMVLAFFAAPAVAVLALFILVTWSLRTPRSHRLEAVVPRRIRLRRPRAKPMQRRSHWTIQPPDEAIAEDDDPPESGSH